MLKELIVSLIFDFLFVFVQWFIVAIFIIISPVIVVVNGIKSAITENKKEGEIYE